MIDAIIPAGGRARRLGGADKPGVEIAGTTLLDRVLLAIGDVLRQADETGRIIVLGPERPVVRPVIWRRETPKGAGPVAAIAAGLTEVGSDRVLLIAADLPNVGPALPQLLNALDADRQADAAVLTGPDGRRNHLAAAWRTTSLRAAIDAIGDPVDVAVRRLERDARVIEVPDADGWGADCDSWDDIQAARRRAALRNGAQA